MTPPYGGHVIVTINSSSGGFVPPPRRPSLWQRLRGWLRGSSWLRGGGGPFAGSHPPLRHALRCRECLRREGLRYLRNVARWIAPIGYLVVASAGAQRFARTHVPFDLFVASANGLIGLMWIYMNTRGALRERAARRTTQDQATAERAWLRNDPLVPTESAQVLEGWREYRLVSDGSGGWRLQGMHVQWAEGTLRAECVHGLEIADCLARSQASLSPECGIYSTIAPPRAGADPFRSMFSSIFSGVFGSRVSPYGAPVWARVVNGGVVQRHTKGYIAELCRIEQLFLVAGDLQPGDTGYDAQMAESAAADLERTYDAPVVITTDHLFQEEHQQPREDGQQWARLAHMSKRFASRYPLDGPSELSPHLRSELSDLLPESL